MIISVDLDYFYPENNSIFDYCITDNFYLQDNSKVDYTKLNQIKHLLKNKNVKLLQTHDELLQFIKPSDVVVNFDFHHDIVYETEDIKKFPVFRFMETTYKEACWAGYAIKYLNIDYYWIGDENSYFDPRITKLKFKKELTFDLDSDIIYLIRSEKYLNEKQFEFVWRYLFF